MVPKVFQPLRCVSTMLARIFNLHCSIQINIRIIFYKWSVILMVDSLKITVSDLTKSRNHLWGHTKFLQWPFPLFSMTSLLPTRLFWINQLAEWQTVQTLIRLQSDLALHCLLRHVCSNSLKCFGNKNYWTIHYDKIRSL